MVYLSTVFIAIALAVANFTNLAVIPWWFVISVGISGPAVLVVLMVLSLWLYNKTL